MDRIVSVLLDGRGKTAQSIRVRFTAQAREHASTENANVLLALSVRRVAKRLVQEIVLEMANVWMGNAHAILDGVELRVKSINAALV